jgi:hypothetical protein
MQTESAPDSVLFALIDFCNWPVPALAWLLLVVADLRKLVVCQRDGARSKLLVEMLLLLLRRRLL